MMNGIYSCIFVYDKRNSFFRFVENELNTYGSAARKDLLALDNFFVWDMIDVSEGVVLPVFPHQNCKVYFPLFRRVFLFLVIDREWFLQNFVLGGDRFCPRLRFLQAWLQKRHPWSVKSEYKTTF